MKIETLADWNAYLGSCCGCGMPQHAPIGIVSESLRGQASRQGFIRDDSICSVRTTTYRNGDVAIVTYSQNYSYRVYTLGLDCHESEPDIDYDYEEAEEEPDPYPPADVVEYSDCTSNEAWRTSAENALLGVMSFPSDCAEPSQGAQNATNTGDTTVNIQIVRYRFRAFLKDPYYEGVIAYGKTYDITWDVLTENEDEEIEPVLETGLTTSFTHTENEDEEDESWFSEWHELPLPKKGETIRVVNVRYTNYKSLKFGMKPSTYGEGYELP